VLARIVTIIMVNRLIILGGLPQQNLFHKKSKCVETPKRVWELTKLQTLKGNLVSMDLVELFDNLTQLITLPIKDV
jgi:hypothetical protein